MTDFERIKKALIDGGFTPECYEYFNGKSIYFSKGMSEGEIEVEFDVDGNLLRIF